MIDDSIDIICQRLQDIHGLSSFVLSQIISIF
jgi:hypothetical protein